MSDAAASTLPRSGRRTLLFGIVVLCAGLMGEKCEPLFMLPNQTLTANPGTCTMLPSTGPLALAFASSTLWVANRIPLMMVPFDVDETPPQIPSTPLAFPIPDDSDGNGTADEDEPAGVPPIIDDIIVSGRSDLLLPTFEKEGVILFSSTGALVRDSISVPSEFDEADNPQLPAPGGSNRNQTGFSTKTCIVPPPGEFDSDGNPPIADCTPGFFSRTTSGVAVDSELELALVTFENRNADLHQPGVVSVYDFGTGINPHQISRGNSTEITTIFTSGFSPSDIVIHETTDVNDDPRRFALVAVSGAIAPRATRAAIDVIDIETLELVATFPLGIGRISPAGIQIDAARSVAVVGSTVAREIYAVDLGVLQTEVIPTTTPASGNPLDLSAGVIEGAKPLALDRRSGATPIAGCPGAILGLGFNHAGTRLFATDNCDGSFIAIEFSPNPATFGAQAVTDFAAARNATGTRARGAGRLVVRPEPLTNYDGPDVFVLVNEPEGMVCALFIDAVSP